MMLRGKDLALSVLVVGTAAAAGYVIQSGRRRGRGGRARASVGARVVEDVPVDATVVDVSSRRLDEIPGVRRALHLALDDDAREEWEQVTIEDDGAWGTVDALRRSLPYHEADGAMYNGVYVQCGNRVVVVDAVGWARVEEVPQ